jgi:Uma2 family endonuclease
MVATVEVENDYEIERNKPMPSKNHGITQANLTFLLMTNYRKKFRLMSEVSLQIDGWDFTPDIAIFEPQTVDYRNDEIRMQELPLGVIEILSPTQSLQDLSDKAYRYMENGVKSCWIVIPNFKSIYVFSLPDDYEVFAGTETLHDTVLNISLPLTEVFN